MNKIKHKKTCTPWYTEIVNHLAEEGKDKIPVITGIFKGDQSVKISPTIKKTTLRQIEMIRNAASNTFQINTDVERAAINIGIGILFEMYVDSDNGLEEVCAEEDKFTEKMIALDDFVRVMHKMYSCWEKKVFSSDDVENMRKWVELQNKHIGRMDELGMKGQAEEKLRMIKAGEKVSNLLECKARGGDRS